MSSWIRLCQVRLRHAASVLGIIDGCVVACCRIFFKSDLAYEAGMPEDRWFVGCMLPDFPCCELAYEAGMPEDQLFWVPRRSRLFPGPRVCLRP